MSNPSSSSPSDVAWDEIHCDQMLDVVLKSTVDNVYFRVASFVLKRETSLYKDMLTMIPNGHMTTEDAIPLDFDAATVHTFLDCVNTTGVMYYAVHSVLQLGRLLRMVRYADCERLLPYIEREFKRACIRSLHDWLRTAIDLDDHNEVSEALGHCARTDKPLDGLIVKSLTARVNESWQYPLTCSFMTDTPFNSDGWTRPFAWPTEEKITALLAEMQNRRGGVQGEDEERGGSSVAGA